MIENLLTLVIYIVVLGLVVWLLLYVVSQLPLPAPFPQVARVLIVVIACICLIYLLLGLLGGVPAPRLR